jgi:hypothetical protein
MGEAYSADGNDETVKDILEQPKTKRLRWSRGCVLAFSTQVRGFKPGRKNPQHDFLRRRSKAVCPTS